jgi:hypothetical protein
VTKLREATHNPHVSQSKYSYTNIAMLGTAMPAPGDAGLNLNDKD